MATELNFKVVPLVKTLLSDTKVAFESPNYIVYQPHTPQALYDLGKGCGWCTSDSESDDGPNHYSISYLQKGDMYVVFKKGNKRALAQLLVGKYHEEYRYRFNEYVNPTDLVKDHPELWLFIQTKVKPLVVEELKRLWESRGRNKIATGKAYDWRGVNKYRPAPKSRMSFVVYKHTEDTSFIVATGLNRRKPIKAVLDNKFVDALLHFHHLRKGYTEVAMRVGKRVQLRSYGVPRTNHDWPEAVDRVAPESEMHTGTAAPSLASVGDLWFDTDLGELMAYDGSEWQLVGERPNIAEVTTTEEAVPLRLIGVRRRSTDPLENNRELNIVRAGRFNVNRQGNG